MNNLTLKPQVREIITVNENTVCCRRRKCIGTTNGRLTQRDAQSNTRPDERALRRARCLRTADLKTLDAQQSASTQVLTPAFAPTLMLDLLGNNTLAVPTMMVALLDNLGLVIDDMSACRIRALGGATVLIQPP